MKAYDCLSTFPDVSPGLSALSKDPSVAAYVFSNGTDAMVSTSIMESSDLSPYASVFMELITIEEVQCYKPDMRVYQHLAKKTGKEGRMDEVWLVSGNPFDIVGAVQAGCKACWVDRAGGHHRNGGWSDQLGELASGGPTVVVDGVDGAVKAIKKWVEENGKGGAGVKREAEINKQDAGMGPG